MQNFKKYGIAAAVASVATGAVAQSVSNNDLGDAAIVPYYTANDGKITGVHIVNTTDSTQAVKVRLRRGSDSVDAMDFNVVLSPYDEWTAYVGKKDGNVGVGTSDNSCTVPVRLGAEGWADMPATNAEGASEGYIEVIAMGETLTESEPVAKAALHKDGTPADCAAVEKNFYRVAAAKHGDATQAGVHENDLTSSGFCAKVDAAATVTACRTSAGATAANLSDWTDSADQALKVSYFIREGATEGEGGMEMGANAVMLEGFTDAFATDSGTNGAVITNQVQLTFDGTQKSALLWDPQNFEFPNLGQAYGETTDATDIGFTAVSKIEDGNDAHAEAVRKALDADVISNEWADNDAADADWVVTLPGQYAMRDGICARYAVEGPKTACVTKASYVATDALALDDDQLPFYLINDATNTKNYKVYDREEGTITVAPTAAASGIDFSPSSNETEGYDNLLLYKEVNVIVWGADDGGVMGSAAKQDATHGLMHVIGDTGEFTEGWATLTIEPKNDDPDVMFIGKGEGIGDALALPSNIVKGSDQTYVRSLDVEPTYTPVVGLATWKREFSSNASANYGRAIEHSITSSTAP